MSDRVEKTERQLNLIALLLSARTPQTKEEILSTVDGYRDGGERDAVERRFERDKADLHALGLALEHTTDSYGQSGYVIRKEQCLLPTVPLTAEERVVLERLARRFRARPERGGVIDTNLATALLKLKFDAAPGELDDAEDSTAGDDVGAFFRVGLESRADSPLLDALSSAVLSRHTVRFSYLKPDDDSYDERTVDPWALLFVGGFWYCHGFCHTREAPRTFKFVRIDSKAKLRRTGRGLDPEFPPPENFDRARVMRFIEEPLTPALGADSADGTSAPVIRLAFAPEVAFMVRETHAGLGTFVDTDEGGTEMTLTVPRGPALWRFFLRYAPHVRVLAPDDLRAEFATRIRELRAQYTDA